MPSDPLPYGRGSTSVGHQQSEGLGRSKWAPARSRARLGPANRVNPLRGAGGCAPP